MGMLDSLKAIVGAGARVGLDEPAAEGTAEAAVSALIANVRRSIAPKLREGCTAAYLEAVITRTELDACTALLTGALGPPSKPFDERPAFDKALTVMIDSQGGIDANQCLHLRRYEDGRVAFAALWPWRSGVEITLKVGVYAVEATLGAA